MSIRRVFTFLFAMLLVSSAFGRARAQVTLTTVRVASGLGDAIYCASPPGDFERLFIVEQSGVIRILDLISGQILPTPFLDIDSSVIGPTSSFDERGLLGLAFHPNYAANGYFYVYYVHTNGETRLERYEVTSNPDVANPASATVLMSIPQVSSSHNGGTLKFGPLDGYLYIGVGDGGGVGDSGPTHPPEGNGQSGTVLLGKMLRIDVDSGFPYAIPSDNPFVGDPTHRDEIWSKGLRNPYRFTFDELTGDLYIADVGEYQREEIDFEPALVGGRNYGWRCLEGTSCTGYGGCQCSSGALTFPVYEYTHTSGSGCAVIGGELYRGCAIPDLQGHYFFHDWCEDRIYSARINGSGSGLIDVEDRTDELTVAPYFLNAIAGYGTDAFGEIYMVNREASSGSGGEVYKIVPTTLDDCDSDGMADACAIEFGFDDDCNGNGTPDSCDIASGYSEDANSNGVPDECETPGSVVFDRGDCNDDGSFNMADVVTGLNLVFFGSTVSCRDGCDVNDDENIDVADAVYALAALFTLGSPPAQPSGSCGLDPTSGSLNCESYSSCP